MININAPVATAAVPKSASVDVPDTNKNISIIIAIKPEAMINDSIQSLSVEYAWKKHNA